MGSFRPRGLLEWLQIFWRRRTMLAFVTVIVLLAATAVILSIQKVYESRALIVVSGAIYDKTANGAQVAAVTEQITSRANLEAIIQRYNLFAPVTKMDATVAQFAKDIKFDTKYRSDSQGFPESFTVAYRHTDPVIAAHVVTDLVAVFDQANKTLEKQAAEEMQRVKKEIAEVDAKLGHANARRIASAYRSSAASRTAGAIERQRAERNVLSSSLEALKDRQFALEAQIADQKKLIAQQEEVVRTGPPPADDLRPGNYGALLKR
ncbi:MAG TPA: Wzz/FepE/Etk N-terminal domain-containing protein [Blastocatellia bacterium]|nr:Wzz/FepE/Etk N-terminal domain-containing protein [Blastocatellia bacterium]